MRSYVLANNTAHYDAVIAALEARGLRTIPAFASGLDARPAVEAYFKARGAATIDALVSLTGFSLVGGPAYNDSNSATKMLGELDVPYIAAQALEFQTIEEWESSDRGLSPVEATMMVAIPELDGATAPIVFGGRSSNALNGATRDIQPHRERIARLADRVERLVRLRAGDRAKRKVAIVLFNFPPNAGATGTAAFLGVYESLHRTLKAMQEAGYTVEVPETVDALRAADRRGQHRALRRRRQCCRAYRRRRSHPARGASRGDRGAMGRGAGPASDRRRGAVRARRAVRKRAGRDSARHGLRRRPDAPAV